VDLDGATEIYRAHGWSYPYADDPVFESGLRNTLHLLSANGIRATMFTVAGSLDDSRKRELIQEAARGGHEIASHSLTHRMMLNLTLSDKSAEIAGSRDKLEAALGVTVRGFRAPGYLLDREGLELLAKYGYEYDSSAFPTPAFAQRLRTSVERLTAVHAPVPGSPLIELPLPDHRPSPFPFSPSYSLLFGERYFRWGLERCARARRPFVLLFHLIDLADPIPRERHFGMSRLFTLSYMSARQKMARCQKMLDLVKSRFVCSSTSELLVGSMPAAAAAAR
jgi:hypothetical protein